MNQTLSQAVAATVTGAETEDIRRARDLLTKLLALREQETLLLKTLETNQKENNGTQPDQHRRPRPPLKPPRPGSVRADVYAVLGGDPMHSREIALAIAKRRGTALDEKLAATVGNILRDQFDKKIERVAYGIYRLRKDGEKRNRG